MAVRVPVKEATKPAEKQTYFSSEFGLNKVAGLAVGKEACIIPIGLEQGIYKTPVHKVRAKGDKNGFKGWFNTTILCKGYDPETGERNEEALCCQYAQSEKERVPEKEDSGKRMITFTSMLVHIPVLVLGATVPERFEGKMPQELLSVKVPQFSYLEFAASTFESEIVGGLRKKLEDDEVITYKTTEEEAQDIVNKWLMNCIIKVKCEPTNKNLPYEKKYTFIPFYSKKIGAETGERENIIHYRKNESLMAEVNKFLTLFDTKVDELVVSDWKDEDLREYIEATVKRKENLGKAIEVADKEALPKAEQTVEFVEEVNFDEPVAEAKEVKEEFSDIDTSFFEEEEPVVEKAEPAVEISDEDTSFDIDTDESFFDDIDGID